MRTAYFKSTTLAFALSALAAPTVAQGMCSGVGSDGIWIGGSEGASDISTSNTYREQMALVLGGSEYISLFTLSARGDVRIEAQGRGSGDPIIEIYNEAGNFVLSDDDSGGNGASRAEVNLDAGTYCVSTTSFDRAPMTAFVRIGRNDQEPLTEGIEATSTQGGEFTSCANALDIGVVGADGLTNLASVDDAPNLRFTLTSSMPLTIKAENEDADPVITLYDAEDSYIDENDDFDGLNSQIDITEGLPAGNYCVSVSALNDTSLPIEVSIGEYDPVAALMVLVDSAEAAPPLDGSVPIADLGALSTRLRLDAQLSNTATWYSVDVAESGLLLIEAISVVGQGDPFVSIFDDFGRLVALNDDHGDSYDAQVAARVNAGTYFIGLREVTDDTQSFVRIGLERWVPAK